MFTPNYINNREGLSISAIEICDGASVYIDEDTQFEKINEPIYYCIGEQCGNISIDKFYNVIKILKSEFSIESITHYRFVKEGLHLGDFSIIPKKINIDRDLTIKKPMILRNDTYVIEGTKDFRLIFDKDAYLRIENGELYLKNLHLDCLENNNLSLIVASESKLFINNCFIKGGKNSLLAVSSTINASDSVFKESKETGVDISNSKLMMSNCKVFNNRHYGIAIQEKSFVEITNSEIADNCNIDRGYSQIYIDNSEGTFIDTRILNSINGIGISLFSSKVKLSRSEIINNNYNGINLESKSQLILENCRISNNGKNRSNYPQVFVEDSEGLFDNTIISDSPAGSGIYIYENSKVFISYSKVVSNKKCGIEIYDNSSVIINSSEIVSNETDGIEIHNGSSLKMTFTKIVNNKYNALYVFYGCNVKIENCEIEGSIYGKSRVTFL